MSNRKYNKIQMIGFVLSTTPGYLRSIKEMSDNGRYLGHGGSVRRGDMPGSRLRTACAVLKKWPDRPPDV